MNIEYAVMTIDHYDEALALWRLTEGIDITVSDSREGTSRYLARNPGMSFVALDGRQVVGTILCGHDGRRGCLTHLAVDGAHRRMGIGARLVRLAVDALVSEGLIGCNLFIYSGNAEGRAFWQSQGWTWPDTWGVMSRRFVEG